MPIALAVVAVAAVVALAGAGDPGDAPVAPPIPAHVRALVTGSPASPDFIRSQIAAAVAREIGAALAPGSEVAVTEVLPAPQRLERGFLTSLHVQLRITDPGGGVRTAQTIADVDNVDLPGSAAVTLAFRDDPEKVTADGVLSRTVVSVGQPTRVYYYHQDSGTARRLIVVLAANGSVRTRVVVVRGDAGPNIDVMSVGHSATKTFLERRQADEGSVLTIAGGRPAVVRDTPMKPGEVVVGAVDLTVLDGGPATMTVLALPPDGDPAAYLYGPKLPDDGHGRHGDFDLAGFGQRIIAYTVGGRDATYTYGGRGQTPGTTPGTQGHDFGDYGVLERVTFDVDNPTDNPAQLYLFESPHGGDVRSTFLVDGSAYEVGCVRVPQRYAIASTTVPPHTSAALDVVTMPDGGSNYPLEIGLTATPPQPTAPPISAPDGCFPKRHPSPSGGPAAAPPPSPAARAAPQPSPSAASRR